MTAESFVERCLAGHSRAEDIHDFIDAWHEGTSDLPLWRFLGMTFAEYELWVQEPSALARILRNHGTPTVPVSTR